MSKKPMSAVKLRVWQCALVLCTFTTKQLAEVTGLNLNSIHTELQRMKESGLLTSTTHPSDGRQAVYQITTDKEKRVGMLEQLESFYPKPIHNTGLTNNYYKKAEEFLDLAEKSTGSEAEQVLKQAEKFLEATWYDEGEPQDIRADFIRFQKARLAYIREVKGFKTEDYNFDKALVLLEKAELHFNEALLLTESKMANALIQKINQLQNRNVVIEDQESGISIALEIRNTVSKKLSTHFTAFVGRTNLSQHQQGYRLRRVTQPLLNLSVFSEDIYMERMVSERSTFATLPGFLLNFVNKPKKKRKHL